MDVPTVQWCLRRGAPRLLADLEALGRLTEGDGPRGRDSLEREIGCELADLLVSALARSASRVRAAVA